MKKPTVLVKLPVKLSYEAEFVDDVTDMAYHYLLGGAYDIASELFEGLREFSPNSAYNENAVGLCLDHLGRYEEAEECFLRAIEKASNDATAYLNLAETYLRKGNKSSALKLVEQAEDIAKSNGQDPLFYKAKALRMHLNKSGQGESK